MENIKQRAWRAYIESSKARWTIDNVPKGPPGCPIPSG